MVNQGDIIKVNFNPQKGHEQAGFRLALVVSNDFFIEKTNLAIVCPISNTKNVFPLHVALDYRTQTTGSVLCQHIRTLDLNAREYKFIEKMPKDILENIIDIVFAQVDI